MKFILGEDWLNLFDVVIVSAKKPSFFKSKSKHFRIYSPSLKRLKWNPVLSLEQGMVYSGVSYDRVCHGIGRLTKRYDYVWLNFETLEPPGLLFWVMPDSFLG
jgi:hypothetical protein